ncbi:MAG: FkbM family methyltransferase [Alphaproteobacteria bacterium]|nr:FkbM family methyltransferase [Alphaproteobacteria bacterium]MBU1515467.1 FkbM family methyltransferase [Alphaproteobacteria bacterium]MBU2095465.1 FkbM family methyltransferase [Alphaproteobacteria bacterium]MBU2150707.1 FkbM family methyltransferase [Alphaproteobacteria bacterium]MBU2306971.1 FkbM family methyltransferase [Alphaproteobacteria bacterium]
MLDRTTAYGLDFVFPRGDQVVGASLRRHGEFARVELDFLVEMAGGAGALIDVGANIGAIALPFARAKPDWKVICIEAHRGLHGVLAANALLNGLHNTEVHHAAAGPVRGIVEFPTLSLEEKANFGTLGFSANTGRTEAVRMLTLDEIAPEDTALIKIDVEGFETEVLKGAARLLQARKAIWLAEATIQHPKTAAEVIATLLGNGYRVYWFYAPFVTPQSEKDTPTNAGVGDANVVALPPGVENVWGLTEVSGPDDRRPPNIQAYPYLARYGYS